MADFLSDWILTFLIALPIVGAIAVAVSHRRVYGRHGEHRLPRLALAYSAATLALAIVALVLFFRPVDGVVPAERGQYALVQNLSWVSDVETGARQAAYVDFRYHLGVDGLSIWLIMLTALLAPLSIWASFSGIRHWPRC